MPIVKQKKVTLYALKEKRQELLAALQRYGKMHIELESDVDMDEYISKSSDTAKQYELISWAITQLKQYDERKKPMLAPKPEISYEEIDKSYNKKDKLLSIAQDLRDLENVRLELNSSKIRLDNQILSMCPWEHLDVEVETLVDSHNCTISAGTVPILDAQDFFGELDEIDNVHCHKVYTDRDSVYIMLIYHTNDNEVMLPLLSRVGYSKFNFANHAGKPANIIKDIKHEIHDIEKKEFKIEESIKSHSKSLADMEILLDALMIENSKNQSTDSFESTEYVFMVQGYIPAKFEDELTEVIKKSAGSTIDLKITEPTKDDAIPTLYENRAFIRPFESVTDMFATSKYNALDPNVTMAPFFAIFFGMMMSDAGYGLILAVIASFIYMKTKPKKGEGNKLLRVIAISGVFTILWGILYGGYMGFSLPKFTLLFNPMEEPMLTLGLCLGLGFVHMLLGMTLKALYLIKNNRTMEAISHQFTWIIMLIGLMLFGLPSLASFANIEASESMILISSVGKYIMFIGLAGILVLGGYGKKGFGRIIGGAGSLMDITGLMSDILSYSRLFGLGLATGVIGMVINQLAGMMTGSVLGWIMAGVVFVGAHLFNIALNALGAYVHSSRLQYVEFFGKFFEDGGKTYKPFKMKTKYHNVVDK